MLQRLSPVSTDISVIFPADEEFEFPDDLPSYHGVAWTGSSLTIHKNEDRVHRQIQLARDIFSMGIPQFGSCWALQVAVVAAGGVCAKNPRGREMAISRKISLTAEGRGHPMFQGKSSVFDAFTSHDDEATHVSLGGVILAGNSHSSCQAVCVNHGKGSFWAVQYHPEYDLHEVARLTDVRTPMLIEQGFFRGPEDAASYVETLEALHREPDRKDLRWMVGVDDDVMNERVRCAEVRNWLESQALPYGLHKSWGSSTFIEGDFMDD
eukprot:CAMPEP_0170172022 /NCGR_PEP_ID=MMETSP0040_2-20121228/5242_1 /TAXON_ID=641309 /ORGANISM="Lotharella oceanica, Strain CCMP622" /LENGTH=265 /DNA_ID=CAMNT_0010412441 /DNA_START=171 /DNA_END=969 /DNA_ORIENTATION=+